MLQNCWICKFLSVQGISKRKLFKFEWPLVTDQYWSVLTPTTSQASLRTVTTSRSSTVTPPSLKTARWRTRKRSWWRRSWWKRMPRARSNSSIRLLHCLADVFCRNLKYALIWFFSKPQDPFVISQYHYVIQLLHICNQQSDMMHEDQAKQRRGGTERRLLICTYIWKYLNLTNGLMPIEQRKFLHRKYILKKKCTMAAREFPKMGVTYSK